MTAGFLNESGDFVATINGREISGCPLCGKAPFLVEEDEHLSFRLYCGEHQNIRTLWHSSLKEAEIEWDRIVKNRLNIKSHEESMSVEGESEVVSVTGASIIDDPDRARTCPICGNKPIFRTGKTAAGEHRFALHCNKHRQANNELFRTEWHEDPYEAFNEWISVCTKEEEKVHNELTDFLKE